MSTRVFGLTRALCHGLLIVGSLGLATLAAGLPDVTAPAPGFRYAADGITVAAWI